MSDDEIDYANSEQQLCNAPHFDWQYFAITDHTDSKKGGAKNDICAFCDKASVDAARPEQWFIP